MILAYPGNKNMVPLDQVFGKLKPPPTSNDSSSSDHSPLAAGGGGGGGPFHPCKFPIPLKPPSFVDIVNKSRTPPPKGTVPSTLNKVKRVLDSNGFTVIKSKRPNKWNKRPQFSSG